MVSEINLTAIKREAEKQYLDRDYYCSEAIVATIRKHFQADMPIESIAMASGFPIGVGGAQCICGAVPGGVLCIGYFFGRTTPQDTKVTKAMELSNELLSYFKSRHKVPCCKVHVKDMELGSDVHMEQCAKFTGEIAVKTAGIIARELNIKVVE
jgi:C_GCAxxG_C_C family probable redox protein